MGRWRYENRSASLRTDGLVFAGTVVHSEMQVCLSEVRSTVLGMDQPHQELAWLVP